MRISDWSSDVCSSDLGAAAFLARLPAERWAVVTSAPRALAYVRIAAAGLPMPPLVIGAEDVAKGKPAPDGFLAAAARLGVAPGACPARAEERRVGKECVSPCYSACTPVP